MDPTLIHATLHDAAALLARLRPCFDHGVTQLAQACSDHGKLGNTKLDAHQVLCFELAWASADLLAAETVTSGVTTHTSQVDARLALVFTADAVAAVLARLDGLYLDLKLDLAPLQSIAADPAWANLRREGAGAAALEAAGRAVAEAQGEVGYVALPENLVMAQDAFRRFAADVVAPQAEAIHRHDLTVPETLLAPLREMGVFGLSIPERFGGSAPDDRDDTLMMVTVTEALSEASLAAAGSLITRPEILSRALLSGGTEAQKQHWLPKIAAGDPLAGGITRP